MSVSALKSTYTFVLM